MRETRGRRFDMDQTETHRLLALFDPMIPVLLSLPFHHRHPRAPWRLHACRPTLSGPLAIVIVINSET